MREEFEGQKFYVKKFFDSGTKMSLMSLLSGLCNDSDNELHSWKFTKVLTFFGSFKCIFFRSFKCLFCRSFKGPFDGSLKDLFWLWVSSHFCVKIKLPHPTKFTLPSRFFLIFLGSHQNLPLHLSSAYLKVISSTDKLLSSLDFFTTFLHA